MADAKQASDIADAEAKVVDVDPTVGATAETTLQSCFVLPKQIDAVGRARLPCVGLGVYQAGSGEECASAVTIALQQGYRHIDSAAIYRNESTVGKAILDSGVPRDQIFVTSKLWNSDHGYESTLAACQRSLKTFGLDYLDLYLIHWPVEGKRLDTWRAMEKLLRDGKVRAIGVSNYMVHHLEELLANCTIPPAVNQIEVHPYLTRTDVVDFCHKKGIIVEAYSPLTKGMKLQAPEMVKIAKKYHKTTAQVMLRWALQRGCVVLPKSTNEDRIKENIGIFDFHISEQDMSTLNSFNAGLATGWDPTDAP